MTNLPGRRSSVALLFASLICCGSAVAHTMLAQSTAWAALPSAPQAQKPKSRYTPPPVARKYAGVIEPGQKAQTFTATDKVVFSLSEISRPITILPALYSASYEQLFNTDPKYGHDAGAFGEKFGAAMLRSASVRVFSDGLFAAAFHQDPRYYRIGHGSIVHRGLLSARQALVRRGDDGEDQFNYSGIVGRAAAAAMVVTYYPEPSITSRVVGLTFATSIATDAGGNLVLEFLPSFAHRFPIMKKLGLE